MSMTHRYSYVQLDVFSRQLFDGNPLAVVIDADGLDTDTMQRIARWTNLSETAFLLMPTQPEADYRVRIFTPRQELPFAGHPSVGSAYVAIESGKVAGDKRSLVQECAAGLLPVQVDGEGGDRIIHVQAPPATIHRGDQTLATRVGAALHVVVEAQSICTVDNGPLWIVVDLGAGSFVRGLQPDFNALGIICEHEKAVGVCVFGRGHEDDAAMVVRAFCPADGIPEDPVTGSANAAIAAYLQASGKLARYGTHYHASQGREVGRNGVVEVQIDVVGSTITIGGHCIIGARGELLLGQPLLAQSIIGK
jgi:PhzF family phenazine biosynthesis protein